MDKLVLQNHTGKDITTSLIVAEVFGKRHDNVLRDIENLSCSVNFRLLNFELLVKMKELPQGGASKSEYYEMTKDGFSFLVMGYTGLKAGEFKELFISEFNKRESLLRNDDYIISRALSVLNERTKALEYQINQKDEQLKLQQEVIKESAPKVEYFNEVLQSENLVATNVIAKELGMSAVSLNKLLHSKGIIYNSTGTWVLYAKYQNKGYTETKTHHYRDSLDRLCSNVHTYWTQKGRKFVHDIIKSIDLRA